MDEQLYRIDKDGGDIPEGAILGRMAGGDMVMLFPVDMEVVATIQADVSYDDPDLGDQKYSIHADDLPYPGEYHVVCICGRGDDED